jgi:hypothetical protein
MADAWVGDRAHNHCIRVAIIGWGDAFVKGYPACAKTHREVKNMAKDAPGMRGIRSRNEDGELRRKRSDTHVGTIEEKYGVDLHMRSDAHLDTALDKYGAESLSDLLDK